MLLVTGAGGFVGRWAMAALAARAPDARLVAVHHTAPAVPHRNAETVVLDMRDEVAVDALVRRVRPTAILHLAAISAIGDARRDPSATWDINLGGARFLAEAALANVPECRFVFVGSSDCYGMTFKARPDGVDEDAPLAPTNVYAASKAAADLMIGQMAFDGLRAVRFRPFNHIGPGQSERFAAPSFAAQIARIEAGLAAPSIHVGTLAVERDILDVRDVAAAYVEAMLGVWRWENGAVFNLASGRPVVLETMLAQMISLSTVDVRVVVDPERVRAVDVPRTCGDARRAAALLGWKATTPLERTLADMIEDWRARVRAERAGG